MARKSQPMRMQEKEKQLILNYNLLRLQFSLAEVVTSGFKLVCFTNCPFGTTFFVFVTSRLIYVNPAINNKSILPFWDEVYHTTN
ncbi:CLUMA_CG016069, isoform A [Clunio marinus]|uniref:CLUMA_CG016069, isoform A n=1 Tax=Clunio marinus TaxID=568069 RepID=A0A1J1IRG4_9DIPT|nr:CLUMA_CG016069, isoform A [Clunio marinus]